LQPLGRADDPAQPRRLGFRRLVALRILRELQRLAALSHPRVVVDTSELSPKATELANRLAETIDRLDEARIERLLRELEAG